MLNHRNSIVKFLSLPLLGLLGVLAFVPFNMGGCNIDQANTLIHAGTHLVSAASLDEGAEDEMGKSVAISVTSKYGLSTDARLNEYVNLVGLTVASATNRPDGNWVFGVIESNEVNAFSGPNGYIMVTRGAINQMTDESELAGVLAHEIAHVMNKDGLNAVKQAGMLDALTQAASADERFARFNGATDGLVSTVMTKGYGRDQENKADHDAVKYLIQAGYDPNGLYRLVQRLSAANPRGGGIMSTHPGMRDRAARIAKRIEELNPPQNLQTLQARFAQNVPKTTLH